MFGFWIKFRSLPLVAKIWDVVQTILYGAGWFLVLSYMSLPYGAQREMVYMLLAVSCGLGMVTTYIMDDFVDAGKEMLVLGLMLALDRIWIWFDPRGQIALVYLVGFSILFFENLRQFGFWKWLFKLIGDILASKPGIPRLVVKRGGEDEEVEEETGYVSAEEEEYYAERADLDEQEYPVKNEDDSSA